MEMIVVVAIIAVMVGIAFPSVTAGLEGLRLRSVSDEIATGFNAALNRADRRQIVVEVTVDREKNLIRFASADNAYQREVAMPDGVTIERVLPLIPNLDESLPRQFLVHPGGTVPRIGIQIKNKKNAQQLVMVDPISGTARVQEVQQ